LISLSFCLKLQALNLPLDSKGEFKIDETFYNMKAMKDAKKHNYGYAFYLGSQENTQFHADVDRLYTNFIPALGGAVLPMDEPGGSNEYKIRLQAAVCYLQNLPPLEVDPLQDPQQQFRYPALEKKWVYEYLKSRRAEVKRKQEQIKAKLVLAAAGQAEPAAKKGNYMKIISVALNRKHSSEYCHRALVCLFSFSAANAVKLRCSGRRRGFCGASAGTGTSTSCSWSCSCGHGQCRHWTNCNFQPLLGCKSGRGSSCGSCCCSAADPD
jgi:hypothetical protein